MALRKIAHPRTALTILLPVMLASCAVQTAPRWRLNTDSQLQSYADAVLTGRDKQAAWHLTEAVRESASTADAAAVGRVWLHACAIDTARLTSDLCSRYRQLPQTGQPAAHQSYFAFLRGEWNEVQAELLPPPYRPLLTASAPDTAVAGIGDAQTRLIAAGACINAGKCGESTITLAVDTASAQGWRGAVYPWLLKQRESLLAKGDLAGAERVQARLDLLR